jgi:hypothetical protein
VLLESSSLCILRRRGAHALRDAPKDRPAFEVSPSPPRALHVADHRLPVVLHTQNLLRLVGVVHKWLERGSEAYEHSVVDFVARHGSIIGEEGPQHKARLFID